MKIVFSLFLIILLPTLASAGALPNSQAQALPSEVHYAPYSSSGPYRPVWRPTTQHASF